MKTITYALVGSALTALLNSCAFQTVAYEPGYSADYVYSVNYYNNRPYWGNNYYHYGYGIGDYGYWGGFIDYNGF